MPKKRIEPSRAPVFIIRALRLLAKDPKVHARFRLQAIDRLARIQGLYKTEITPPQTKLPEGKLDADVDIRDLLKEYKEIAKEEPDAKTVSDQTTH